MNIRPLIGAAQLAVGRGAGMAQFGDSPAAFLASLAPLVAFPLVGAGALVLSGKVVPALVAFLFTLIAQLAPAVLSHVLAVRWGREAQWLRYATAFNWCQWAIPVAGFVLFVLLEATGGGMSEQASAQVLIVCLGFYGMWLHWTIARYGLVLPRGRAALLVLLVNVGTIALVMGPQLLQAMVG